MNHIHHCKVACYNRKAAKLAEQLGQDPEETPDIWHRFSVDFTHVIDIQEAQEEDDETGTWLAMTNGRRMRVNIPYDDAKVFFDKSRPTK